MFDVLHDITTLLQSHLDEPWLWLVVFAIAGLDALLPFMPSESTVITMAVLLGTSDVTALAGLTAVAAFGAWAGDCAGHGIGRGLGPFGISRLVRSERGRRNYAWAADRLDRHAVVLIVAGRYFPGGRVASALATGGLRYPFGRFALLDLAGTTIWAVYSVLIGAAGAASFADDPVAGLLAAFALGLLTLGFVEGGRRLLSRREHRRGKSEPHPQPAEQRPSAEQRRSAGQRRSAELRDPVDGVRRAGRRVAGGGAGGGPGGDGADVSGVDCRAPR
ncbi:MULTISPECIES: DedA family protein [Prauserella salsuginis group]|uniref:DedA family protein n=1 Tax=Prauserella salsuginis TaxID=387889 RepID=A0ABW6G1V2_9PSEU|nr:MULTISPECIES: VTT domain-containing protein [Prauserella salsuginis group]MCR3720046.1 membrane protein DedA, SNARE-associated domain [Prauserella flava]MCR3736410.1 membrane protein DedA, SNARE-associated domain [Prauserella salsuginis]